MINMYQGTNGTTYILLLDLSFLLRREVIDNVEQLPDLLRSLPLDHVRDSLASYVTINNIKQSAIAAKDQ